MAKDHSASSNGGKEREAFQENTQKENDIGEDELKATDAQESTVPKTWRFWLVFVSMCMVSFASALDSTIVTTALPTITSSIGGESQYIWIANCFVLASTVVQPLVGQLSNIFGRRWPMMISVLLFLLGSGLAGGANSVSMLIGGRTVQGLGSGGLFVLVDLITCDLVPLRERGQYLGLMLSTAAIGTTLGPVVGGALAEADWRWVFYINLPIAGIAFIAMVFLLNVSHKRSPTWKHALARLDYFGNALFIASITAILLGMIMGGTTYPWRSPHIIVPIVVGGVGWICFHVVELIPSICSEPSVPGHLFTNRTSFFGFVLSFIASMLLEWIFYYLPIYFQSVRLWSPLQSGVDILPSSVFLIPFAGISGGFMSKTGLYRPLHWTGFALIAIASGLFSILTKTSSRAAWVCFQVLGAAGLGALMTTILPSIQASLSESDVASATAMYAFLRSFGFVWGVTIPSVILNARFDESISNNVQDPSVREQVSGGRAYGYAASGYIRALPAQTREAVVDAYQKALKEIWEAAIAFS